MKIMLTRDLIERHARESNEHLAHVESASANYQRDKTPQNMAAHREAALAWHKSENASFYLWSLEAGHKMRAGDRETIEDALLFLEVDPWFFRSGYLKERVIRQIKGAPLSDQDKSRLRNVIFAVSTGRNCREWRCYCRAALVVWTPEWENALREQEETREVSVWGKLAYLLRFFDAHRDKLR